MSEEMLEQSHEEDDDLLVLEDEDGNAIQFQFLEMVQYEGKPYAVLMPLEDDDEEGGVVIVEIIGFGTDSEHYDAVTDEELLDQIFEQFKTEFGDAYDFE